MWHPHIREEIGMTETILGFFIALAVGLTGAGGGSFTTPALVMVAGLPVRAAVGTAMTFSALLRLVATPVYVQRGHVHGRYLKLLLLGAVPGLAAGTFLLQLLRKGWQPLMVTAIGAMLIASSGMTLLAGRQSRSFFSASGSRLLPWLALPIGLETGVSSTGAGALGTILLLNCPNISAIQVIGTDLVFGMVLAICGGAFHMAFGSISSRILLRLVIGGLPGVIIGTTLARKVPTHRLRATVAIIAMLLGMELFWNGISALAVDPSYGSVIDHSLIARKIRLGSTVIHSIAKTRE